MLCAKVEHDFMPHQLLTHVPTNHSVTGGTLVHRIMIVVPEPRSYYGSLTLWLCMKYTYQSNWWILGNVPTNHSATGGTLAHEIMSWFRTQWAIMADWTMWLFMKYWYQSIGLTLGTWLANFEHVFMPHWLLHTSQPTIVWQVASSLTKQWCCAGMDEVDKK